MRDEVFTVAVVGSGPSGFYAAEALLKSEHNIRVNLIEKLPAPFGLVRYGVAPDHPKLKTVSLLYHKIAQNPSLHYYGNVELGRDITLQELKATHHAIVLCNGAALDRRLGIPGEDLPGSYTATEFVAWYNGHPEYRDREFDLSQSIATIIGQGNVAADVCRILAKPVDELRKTDIASHALEQLAESNVREIHVIGRRSAAQAKFTSKELRELGEQTNCTTSVDQSGFQFESPDEEELADKSNDNALKCAQLFRQFAIATDAHSHRNIQFHFLLSPSEFTGNGRLEKIIFDKNQLNGEAFSRRAKASGDTVELNTGLCFRSIGYRGTALDDVPFNEGQGVIANSRGRVIDDAGNASQQLYTSGWIKRGPSGIIGTNRADSVETIASLMEDFDSLIQLDGRGNDAFNILLAGKNVRAINYHQWQQVDALEVKTGEATDKPREKITSVAEMLAIVE